MNILIIIGLGVVCSILLSMGQGWSNILNVSRNDLVFENKNHDYGAYVLRQSYHSRLIYALLFVLLFVAIASVAFSKLTTSEVVKRPLPREEIVLPFIEIPVSTQVFIPQLKQAGGMEPLPKVEGEKPSGLTIIEVVEKIEVQAVLPKLRISGGTDPNGKGNPLVGGGLKGGKLMGGLSKKAEETKVEPWVEEYPIYPGGDDKLHEDISNELEFPAISIRNHSQGKVYVSFVVERDGSITDVKTERGVKGAPELSTEAEDCVKKLKRFTPAKLNGQSVRFRLVLPIEFTLQ